MLTWGALVKLGSYQANAKPKKNLGIGMGTLGVVRLGGREERKEELE